MSIALSLDRVVYSVSLFIHSFIHSVSFFLTLSLKQLSENTDISDIHDIC